MVVSTRQPYVSELLFHEEHGEIGFRPQLSAAVVCNGTVHAKFKCSTQWYFTLFWNHMSCMKKFWKFGIGFQCPSKNLPKPQHNFTAQNQKIKVLRNRHVQEQTEKNCKSTEQKCRSKTKKSIHQPNHKNVRCKNSIRWKVDKYMAFFTNCTRWAEREL